ncbi:MAG: hypothetical protein ACLQBY_14785 [Solirubrobacteraceae bacterium]
MSRSLDKLRLNKELMAYTAAAMYGGAAFDGCIEGFLPGDPSFALAPVLVSIAATAALIVIGPRLPRWALAPLGPIGVVLIAYALTTTTAPAPATARSSTCGPSSGPPSSSAVVRRYRSSRASAWLTRSRCCCCRPRAATPAGGWT